MGSKPKLILSIDDDDDFNKILKKSIEGMGLQSIVTNNVTAFASEMKNHTPDLIIIDLNLDKQTGEGFQLLEKVRLAKGYDIPIFVLSKRTAQEDIAAALELGADEYINKPLDVLVLKEKVNQFINLSGIESMASYAVSDFHSDCLIEFDTRIAEINEYGIIIEGSEFLSSRANITFQSNYLEEITGKKIVRNMKVTRSWFNSERNSYYCSLEFDSEDEEIITIIKEWLKQEGHY